MQAESVKPVKYPTPQEKIVLSVFKNYRRSFTRKQVASKLKAKLPEATVYRCIASLLSRNRLVVREVGYSIGSLRASELIGLRVPVQLALF